MVGFLQGVNFNTLEFRWKSWGIHSTLEGFHSIFWVPAFLEDLQSRLRTCWWFPRELLWGFPSALSVFLFCCWFFIIHPTVLYLWSYLGGAYFFPSERGFLKALGIGLICAFKRCSRDLSSFPSCLVVYLQHSSHWVVLPSLGQVLLLILSSLFSCINKRNKNRGNRKKFFITVLWGFITDLPCHVVNIKSSVHVIYAIIK